jgi:hypothetical protein
MLLLMLLLIVLIMLLLLVLLLLLLMLLLPKGICVVTLVPTNEAEIGGVKYPKEVFFFSFLFVSHCFFLSHLKAFASKTLRARCGVKF